MPYTPPSNRSPASSASSSPNASRRSSLQTGSRPALPRSASYLHKHRRTPSISTASDASAGPLTPQGTSDNLKAMASPIPTSVRQSPPPRTDELAMPMGAVISPPDSASGSDDESGLKMRGRKLDKLQDLRDAVSQIPQQQRTPSPQRRRHHEDKHERNGSRQGVHFSFSTSVLGDLAKPNRKKSHVRSATEPYVSLPKSADNSLTASEEDSDEENKKPQMVRKKSGELVRPALRPPSRRRPSSMPGTPIFSKAVHFDSHLEHVRHFLQVDRPLAVSAGSSPVDNYDSDKEFPFSNPRSPPYEWELVTTNFPRDSPERHALPVRLERVWLSSDRKSMMGSVAVANLAFQKSVTCRFTLDYWKTTSEVVAEYTTEIRPGETAVGQDRFTFSIKLADTANLESKTLFFCIRYSVNGQEYWDNNSSCNFQVDFKKKHLPMNGKNNFQGASSRPANGLPRSNRRANTLPRPKSMPVSFEFGEGSKLDFDQPLHEYLGETGSEPSGLRLKSKSHGNLASDNMAKGFSSPSGLAFSNRYDFGASLNAAVQAAKDAVGKDKDGLYMKPNVRSSKLLPAATVTPAAPAPKSEQAASGTSSPSPPNPTLASTSYEELVNKYCFFGSKQPSPKLKDGTLDSGRFDGTSGGDSGPRYAPHHAGAATHHTLQLGQSGPYYRPNSAGPVPVPTATSSSLPGSNLKAEDANAAVSRPVLVTRATAPPFATFDGAPPAGVPYHPQQPMMHERFPWTGDAHAATAILG